MWVWGSHPHFWGSDPDRGRSAAPFSNPGVLKFGKSSKILKSDPSCPSWYPPTRGSLPPHALTPTSSSLRVKKHLGFRAWFYFFVVVFHRLQVPQRIILQVKQPGPTTLALLPSSCVLGGGQGLGPPAQNPSGHPPCVTPVGHQHSGAAAPQHSSTPKAVGVELWHGESFWGLEPKWGKLDSFVSYF